MKLNYKLLGFLCLVLINVFELFAQSPSAFNYQAIVRNSDGDLLKNTRVSFKISILSESMEGEEVYAETHSVTTSDVGTVSLKIGTGDVLNGMLDSIQWGDYEHFIQTAIDLENGSNFNVISTSQLLSVPYAMHAKTSDDSYWESQTNGISFGGGNVGIGLTGAGHLLDIHGDIATGNRTFLNIQNNNKSTTSSAAMEIRSGSEQNYTVLRMHGDNYDYSWWGRHGQLKTTGEGLIIEATQADDSGGDILFVNGSSGGSQNIKTINMKINGEGNVGIGKEDPNYKLDVEGKINASEFLINGSPISLGYWSSQTNGISYGNGNVGIGLSAPGYLLDIHGDVATGNRTFFNIQNNNESTTSSAAMEIRSGSEQNYTVLRMHGDNYDYSWWGKHGQLKTTGEGLIIEATQADKSGGDILFVNGSSGGNQNIKTINMKINGEGNVGIGTENPKSKLQITSGDIYIEDINSGVIMKSPNGSCWRMTIDDAGSITTTQIECPN